jgi:hypothetical protein
MGCIHGLHPAIRSKPNGAIAAIACPNAAVPRSSGGRWQIEVSGEFEVAAIAGPVMAHMALVEDIHRSGGEGKVAAFWACRLLHQGKGVVDWNAH